MSVTKKSFVFPRLVSARREVALVNVLLAQHEAGRRVTSEIRATANAATLRDADARMGLAATLRSFVRMYRPHAAHENTVVFPAFRRLLSDGAYESLQEDLEKKERAAFGDDLYERVIAEIVAIERELGIDQLARFTPAA